MRVSVSQHTTGHHQRQFHLIGDTIWCGGTGAWRPGHWHWSGNGMLGPGWRAEDGISPESWAEHQPMAINKSFQVFSLKTKCWISTNIVFLVHCSHLECASVVAGRWMWLASSSCVPCCPAPALAGGPGEPVMTCAPSCCCTQTATGAPDQWHAQPPPVCTYSCHRTLRKVSQYPCYGL